MNRIEKVNDIFDKFYKLFYETEDLALKKRIKCLTHTELHIIEAIGEETINMNELSERLGITMGTATVAITKLRKKGFIDRARSDSDRRKVYVSLSQKGLEALKHHGNYHKTIMASITEGISDDDLEHFTKIFENILTKLGEKIDYFKSRPIVEFNIGEVVSVIEIKGTPIVQDYFSNNGIEYNSILKIIDIDKENKIVFEREDKKRLKINILDAKNLIAVKVEG